MTTYLEASELDRVEIIFKNYSMFPSILGGCLRSIIYYINEEIDCKHRAESIAGLGVQNTSLSDRTQKEAIRNVSIEEAVIKCDFDNGILDDTEHKLAFVKRSYDLRKMRRDYEMIAGTINDLLEEDRELLLKALRRQKDAHESEDATKDAMYMRISRIKAKVKEQVTGVYNAKESWLV